MSSTPDAVAAAMHFARTLLHAGGCAFYRVDADCNLHDFHMDPDLAGFHRDYVGGLHAVDPFHARRLRDSDLTVSCLSADVVRPRAREGAAYAAACAAHGIGDIVELFFRREGRITAGLCLTWPAGRSARPGDLAAARAAHGYIEFNLPPPPPAAPQVPGLTAREQEVVGLICAGRTNRDIADALAISLATVKTHIIHIFEKLGVENRASVVARMARG
jgi:DNA-binding CsgD family transcriptional regulator